MNKFYAGIGSRKTPEDVCTKMTEIAEYLHNKGYILRSGGARGADAAFEKGAGTLKEIYLPWKNFNKNSSPLYHLTEASYSMAAQFHPAWHHCGHTARKFHARNCHQILGVDLQTPVEFVVCWTEDGEDSGGTGQAIRVAWHHGIPVYNLFHFPVGGIFMELTGYGMLGGPEELSWMQYGCLSYGVSGPNDS